MEKETIKRKSYKSNNAITLVIVIILVGLAINFVINKVVLEKTDIETHKYLSQQDKEQKELEELYSKINGNEQLPENNKDIKVGTIVKLEDKWIKTTPSLISTQTKKEIESSIKVSTVYAVSTGQGETVPVPIGFYYVGGKINEGVIISDNEEDRYEDGVDKTSHEYATKLKGNQFVWIPCKLEDYKKIDWGKENAKWDMEISEAEKVQVEKYGGFYIGRYEAGVSTYNELTGNFENSVIFNNNALLHNGVTTQTGINNWTGQNYDYIARQEGTIVTTGTNKATGNIVEKANSIPYNFADYYTAVEMTRRMYENHESVISGLVTGTQWDMMMKYMQENGVDVLTSNWGNYDDVRLTDLRGYYADQTLQGGASQFKSVNEITGTNAEKGTRVLLTTGSTEQVKRKNLYDVAGNLWEWTTETAYRADINYNNNTTYNTYMLRGGCLYSDYDNWPVVVRGNSYASMANFIRGFRPMIYMK